MFLPLRSTQSAYGLPLPDRLSRLPLHDTVGVLPALAALSKELPLPVVKESAVADIGDVRSTCGRRSQLAHAGFAYTRRARYSLS